MIAYLGNDNEHSCFQRYIILPEREPVANQAYFLPVDAITHREVTLNKVPFVLNHKSLLGTVSRFQGGRLHMVTASRFRVDKAESVKKAAKPSLTTYLSDNRNP